MYNFTYRRKYGDILGSVKIAKVPDDIKCFFNEPRCDKGDLNGWSLSHFAMYMIIGYFVPKQYVLILIISVLFEIIEVPIGANSKLIIDPITNLSGYWIGSQLS